MNHLTHASKKEPEIDSDFLASANRRLAVENSHAIMCLAEAPRDYYPGMPSALIWEHHRRQEDLTPSAK